MMLQQFGEEIWTATGPTVSVAGFAYPTRMAVIRLTGGALFIWSPVALSADLRTAVDRLGPVHHVVAPNTLHHRFVNEWRAAYPTAKFHAPPELRARRPDLLPRKFRIAFFDRGVARAALHRILAWPSEKILMAHASPIEEDGRAVVARAFKWLLR